MTAYTLTDDEAQEIANVLAGHAVVNVAHHTRWRGEGYSTVLCRCREDASDALWMTVEKWVEHVTAALAPTIADMIAAHRVEALVMDDLAGDETVLLGPVDSP